MLDVITPDFQSKKSMSDKKEKYPLPGTSKEDADALVFAIARQLVRERERLRLNQKDIAKRSGLSARNVSYIEEGRGGDSGRIRYARAMDLSYALVVAKAEVVLEAEAEVAKKFG